MRYPMVLLMLSVAAAAAARPGATPAPRIESFSPQGTVKGVRQATVRFSDAMVRFGDSTLPAPFTVICSVAGQGHWIGPREWVYDFAEDVPPGRRCSFKLKADLKTLSGRPLTDVIEYAFDTGGPTVIDTLPGEGGSIAEDQVFLLAIDAPAKPDSVRAQASCRVEGIGERIEVDLLQGEARQRVITPELRKSYRYFFERFADEKAEQDGLIALACRRHFPPDTAVSLIWGKGIASREGLATSEDRTLEFRTRTPFTARFDCERVNARAQCVPFLPMRLYFSSPIALAQAAASRLVGKDGTNYLPDPIDPVKNPLVDSLTFSGPFPEQAKFDLRLPDQLTDDAGRKLENAGQFPLEVATDDYPPLAKFSGEFGIIEAKEGGVLPVTLRNLEAQLPGRQLATLAAVPGRMQQLGDDGQIIQWIRKVETAAERRGEWVEGAGGEQHWRELTGSTSVFDGQPAATEFSLPKPLGDKAFEVVGIPLPQTGFYVVELASPRLGAALLGEPKPRYVATSALVTNLAVHFKWGRQGSLAWVTSLDQAQPVPNAAIRVSHFCNGQTLWEGRTDANGLARIEAGKLPEPNGERQCTEWNESSPPLFVSARVDGDLGFVISGWNRGIQPGDFGLTTGSEFQAKVAHGVFDRTLLRAGETVSMKLLLRERTAQGFVIPSDAPPNQLRVRHVGSGQTYTQPVAFDGRGSAEANWAIPREAKLGAYEVQLYRGDDWAYDAGQFQVQQFRVPTMKASIQPVSGPFVNAKDATVDVFVGYLNGGGAKALPVKLRTLLRPRSVSYPAYADYQFGGEDVAEGIQDEGNDEEEEADDDRPKPARVLPLTLDDAGAARARIPDLPKLQAPQDLVTEVEYQDANGERLTIAQNIPLWPAKLNLGLRTEGWVASKNRLRFHLLALDLDGKPLTGQRVDVALLHKTTFSYRKRLIGGFYAYENKSETKRLEPVCAGTTDRLGVLDCDLKPGVSGDVILRATARDDAGNLALATQDVWVEAGEDWWFDNNGPGDRMDVLPEQTSYEPGHTARFQVRSPFRDATALISVEREGVIDAFVAPLSGRTPVVEVPIKDHYAPNVYVSVLAVRGRPTEGFAWLKTLGRKLNLVPAEDEGVTALVDLNKPAYRLGVGKIDVGWTPNRLEVGVAADRTEYKVRDKAKVSVSVKRADGGPLPSEAEFAFAAVDEGLLELKPNLSWRLLDRMMGRRDIEVYTATAQMQVVGKRHYGRKSVPHGGGGGKQAARELFDTLLLWRGRVPLDTAGRAELEVPLNDALTAFRLTAVADAGSGLFGTGDASIRTRQDLMTHSGLPPVVREGDRFTAGFNLRNGSDRALSVRAEARLNTTPQSAESPPLDAVNLTLTGCGEPDSGAGPGAGDRLAGDGAAERVALELGADRHRTGWRGARPVARCPGSDPGRPGPRASGDAGAASPTLTDGPGETGRCLAGAGWRQNRPAIQTWRRRLRCARLYEGLSLQLPRAARLEGNCLARCVDVAGGQRADTELPGWRWPVEILPIGCAEWQRGADCLRAFDCTRGRLGAAAFGPVPRAGRPENLRRRASGSGRDAECAGSGSAQAGRARRAGTPSRRTAGDAGQPDSRPTALADFGPARLADYPAAYRRRAAARRATQGDGADPEVPLYAQGHHDGVVVRHAGSTVVADAIGRRRYRSGHRDARAGSGLEGGSAADCVRRAAAPGARPLGHDRRQCLGRAGDGDLRAGLPGRSRYRNDERTAG